MNETSVTLVGNLVHDPRLRTTVSGVDVAGFRVASTARRWDRATGRWSDAGSLFLSVTCWRTLAGNAVASLRKGDPVVVTGRLSTRTYEMLRVTEPQAFMTVTDTVYVPSRESVVVNVEAPDAALLVMVPTGGAATPPTGGVIVQL